MTRLTKPQREKIVLTFWAVLVYAAIFIGLFVAVYNGTVWAVDSAQKGDWAPTCVMGGILSFFGLLFASYWFIEKGGD